ncbi:uncharacterized protein MELLADRAFT_110672 [Melampsora larici-populina 98AG31]|uniref:Uncharacterized protein n=1 Tax=Melampsora larici-populina (strain 98AG31 / pathotype 3-4-7) TaxID=747676 RepID=F4S0K4_MELLP|nr:uncharacterized protein MELLADRAFT_110672 [Melampsora larici-populina 98AG31]EGG01780.1 hypothetical protein MELLADRAFT_110672 [Melampsora larici-populina 98AG31]
MDPASLQEMLQKNYEAQQQQIASQNELIKQMQQQAATREKAYEDLLNKFQEVGVKNATAESSPSSNKQRSKPRASTGSIPNKPTSSSLKPSKSNRTPSKMAHSSTPPRRSSTPKTPKTSTSRVRTSGPPKPSPKQHPDQLKMSETPKGYEPTKNCFYVFIRIIWGLTSSSAVPKPPNPEMLTEFNARFSESAEIEAVLDSTSAKDLVDQREVKVPKAERVNIGSGRIVNIKEFFVLYTKAMFAKLGIREWCPDLDSSEDTLWNDACRISALRIFCQWVADDAFAYMNINKGFTNNILLLEKTYNHYVHYWYGLKYKREAKEEGKNLKDDERRNVLARRRREAEAHSDDEWSTTLNAYIVKTPVFRSVKAGIFIRRLDQHMKQSADLDPRKTARPRQRVRPRPARQSIFTKAPKGLPLDFYDADWFNNSLSVAQRLDIADCDSVAFLPNPELSLLGKTHPDERKNDRWFNEKYWAESTKEYNLDHFIDQEPDEDGDSESGNSTEREGSIELEESDGEDNEDAEEEEDEYEDFDIGKGSKGPKCSGKNKDIDEEGEFEEDDAFEDTGKGKGKGPLFVDDLEMEDDGEEEARAARFDSWKKA